MIVPVPASLLKFFTSDPQTVTAEIGSEKSTRLKVQVLKAGPVSVLVHAFGNIFSLLNAKKNHIQKLKQMNW